ncbi:MAG: hypothetical protein M3548_07420, partial [Actinomycetota bacterium]|nr:hypothetical protein [Actinomycetota bacterium]
MITDWKPKLAALVAVLVDQGHLRGREWVEAFLATPRHLFTPEIIITGPDGYRLLSDGDSTGRQEWLCAVYSDESLVTQDKPHAAGHVLPSGEPLRVQTSSSTIPSLMARMLEALDLDDGMRVLEIGTGTGYNAALLSHRLAQLDYAPTPLTGDGTTGAAVHGPYDRIIATAAVSEIPISWARQLDPGGKILVNLRGDLAGGTLCLLSRKDEDDEVIGLILPIGGHFMWLRPNVDDPHRPHEHTRTALRGTVSRGVTHLDPGQVPVDDDGFRFLLQLQLHAVQALWQGLAFDPVTHDERDAVIVTAADGSRAEAFTSREDDDSHRVVHT